MYHYRTHLSESVPEIAIYHPYLGRPSCHYVIILIALAKDAIGEISNFSNFTQTARVDLYDMLKAASKEIKVNRFETETFLTKYAEEGISAKSYTKWLKNARTNMITDTECSYEEICSYLRKLNKEYEKDFIENANWPKGVKFPALKAHLVNGLDKHLLKLERLRAGLPKDYQGFYKNGKLKYNIAYSTSEIEGYDIKEIKAFSQYGNIGKNGIVRIREGWVSAPEKGHYSEYVLDVNSDYIVNGENAYPRINASERKLIEFYHTALGDNFQMEGVITIASEHEVCPSCISVMKAFSREYPNLEIMIIDSEGRVNILKNGIMK